MDRIVESFVKDFKEEHGHTEKDITKLFEYFVNYCVISKIDSDRSTLEKVNVGGKGNPGIDGLAIIVNGHVVNSIEEVEYFYKILKRLEVEFVFVQSKSSEKYDMGEINNFLFTVRNFFGQDEKVSFADEVLNLKELKDYIFSNSIKMDKSPICKLYFATTGKWMNDVNLTAAIESGLRDLKDMGIFSSVMFYPIDAEKIKSLYRELKNKITKEIVFEKHTILPKIANVTESYIGILNAKEFVKLICDDEEQIQNTLFYDNVRDFQGYNPVNTEIRYTIENVSLGDKFVLLNNGVTIVAKSINKVGAAFKINDFQIVNGCQTSHVVFDLKNLINDQIFIPLKLIVTDDPDVTNQIIKATNRQTEVKSEAFEILSPFHKKLEEFYLSFEKDEFKRLYYERRSRQYEALKINKYSIVTLSAQISSFVAMFLNEPHSTHRYYGELLDSYRSKLFQDNHSLYPYYTSGLALYVVEDLFRNGVLDSKWRKYKYHLLMLFRVLAFEEKMPLVNSRDMESYCLKICENLWNRDKARQVFVNAQQTLEQAMKKTRLLYRQTHALRVFTEELLPTLRKNRYKGEINYYNANRGFGFIKASSREDIFFHVTEIDRKYDGVPSRGMIMEFDIYETDKGPQAKRIVVFEGEGGVVRF
jgi:cold shock CspA family protein